LIPLGFLLVASLGAQERVVVFTNVSVIPVHREARGVRVSRADIDRRLAEIAAGH